MDKQNKHHINFKGTSYINCMLESWGTLEKMAKKSNMPNYVMLFHCVLDINLRALSEIISGEEPFQADLVLLVQQHQGSINDVIGLAKDYRMKLNIMKTYNWVPENQLSELDQNWWNTIKYTLYHIEEPIFDKGSVTLVNAVQDLWDVFLRVDSLRDRMKDIKPMLNILKYI